jgi:hypothetical protein
MAIYPMAFSWTKHMHEALLAFCFRSAVFRRAVLVCIFLSRFWGVVKYVDKYGTDGQYAKKYAYFLRVFPNTVRIST